MSGARGREVMGEGGNGRWERSEEVNRGREKLGRGTGGGGLGILSIKIIMIQKIKVGVPPIRHCDTIDAWDAASTIYSFFYSFLIFFC